MVKKFLKLAFTYVGALVGAGFASGQELVKFFVSFNFYGLWGVIEAGFIFAVLGGLVIILVNKINAVDYSQLLQFILPRNLKKIVDIIIVISLWLGLGIMLNASSTLIKEQISLSKGIGFFITGFLVYFCLRLGIKSLLNANAILVPLLILLAMGSSILYIIKPVACFEDNIQVKNLLPNWWIASLIYVAFNMVLGITVLASVKEKDEKLSPWGGIIGGLLLGSMAWFMVKGLLLLPNNLLLAEMPMLIMTSKIHPLVGKLYGLGLWVALFTTALANAHSLTTRINSQIGNSYRRVLIFVIISTFVFIQWKFSILVGIIYPLLGYLGLPLIIGIIVKSFVFLKT